MLFCETEIESGIFCFQHYYISHMKEHIQSVITSKKNIYFLTYIFRNNLIFFPTEIRIVCVSCLHDYTFAKTRIESQVSSIWKFWLSHIHCALLRFGLVLGWLAVLNISAILLKYPTIECFFSNFHEQKKYKIKVSAHWIVALKLKSWPI